MTELLARPPASGGGSGRGLFRQDFFQICHATNDIDRALGIYRERFGIRKFETLAGQLPEGGQIHIELAWAGGVMYELLTAIGAGSEAFMELLPPGDAFALRFHHLGFLVPDQAGWEALEREIAECGGSVRAANNVPGFMKFSVVQVPWLGHFLEFIHAEPPGIAFLEKVPAN